MREKTKVVQIDGDWPGLFICGQDAVIDLWNTIERAEKMLDEYAKDDPWRRMTVEKLREFRAKLDECGVKDTDWITRHHPTAVQLTVKT